MIDCISVGETEFPFSLLANYYLQIEIEANKNKIEAGVDLTRDAGPKPHIACFNLRLI